MTTDLMTGHVTLFTFQSAVLCFHFLYEYVLGMYFSLVTVNKVNLVCLWSGCCTEAGSNMML